jgi:hypothetical protein
VDDTVRKHGQMKLRHRPTPVAAVLRRAKTLAALANRGILRILSIRLGIDRRHAQVFRATH